MDHSTNEADFFKVTIEDGACIFVFLNELSAQHILSAQVQAIALIDKHEIEILPFIIDLSHIEDQGIKVEVSDFGKVISSESLASRCSGVWIVGAKGHTRVLAILLNKAFLGNRIHIVGTLEEAKAGAREIKDQKLPMLEQDVD